MYSYTAVHGISFDSENRIFKVFECDLLVYSSFSEIIEKVKAGVTPPFRPVVKEPISAPLKNLMDQCLQEDPSDRPDCNSIKTIIKKMSK